ncbi:hypothetical protein [Flexivirga sp.]|uniref:hypothetical protein n=1 Tax=Flexivirga sp. TaxID=1962927 RepID=UPI003F7DB19D
MSNIIRKGFVVARNTTTDAKEYVPSHWVGSSWFPQYQPLKSSAAARPAVFDPAEHNVDEVLAHLADADAAEVDRVKSAEASGKGRSTIAAFKPNIDTADASAATSPKE